MAERAAAIATDSTMARVATVARAATESAKANNRQWPAPLLWIRVDRVEASESFPNDGKRAQRQLPKLHLKIPTGNAKKKKNRKRKTQDDNVGNKWKFRFTSLVAVRQCNVKEESSWKLYQQTKAEIPKTEIDMLLKPKNEERIDIECNHQTFFSFLFSLCCCCWK